MAAAAVCLGLVVLVGASVWRPHGAGPALGAIAAVALAIAGGAAYPSDIVEALATQWRAYVTLVAIMAMTSAAERLGLFERLAGWIEPRTRGPVRNAFRVSFALSALVATVLSNDAAILVMTPTVLTLLRAVYPKRNSKFLVPFVVAVFASAGVAPLVISNPMNLIFADHVGIGFNQYSATMIPIAVVGWLVTYAVLAWWFREPLADVDGAMGGEWPKQPPLQRAARIVLLTLVVVLVAYPIASYLDLALWPVAGAGGLICIAVCLAQGHRLFAVSQDSIAGGIAWPIFPFLIGVFVIALALGRIGVVDWLHDLYVGTDHPIAMIGTVSSIGSATLNNHSMSVLDALALDHTGGHDSWSFAALVGGNLGPRLLPIGSIASLLWFDLLRKHQVTVGVPLFIRVGVALTIPTLVVSLVVLWLIQGL